MSTIYTQQDSNRFKTIMLMTGFLTAVIAIGYAAAWYLNNPLIVYIAVIFALGMNVYSYWFSDRLVLRMTGAKPVTKAEAPELYNIVENLAITAGLPMPKVYIMEDPSPNAFATGRNPENAVVAVTTGLLSILDRNELEGVVAHEMAHIGNRDMLVMTVAVVLAGFVAILADFLSRAFMFGGGDNRERSPIFLILGIAGIILAPIAAQLIQLAISRKREYLADATAALLTRYPEGLASALEKISRSHIPMQTASHATAHLFISDPYAAEGKRSIGQKISGLFATHPPAVDRIRLLRQMDV
ncbi:M48 family metalloprotease [Patescibacteria group bacterium]|nr:M48 family metalloprotease [Patescibacteria group bacterium]